MEINTHQIRDLLDRRDAIDSELAAIFAGGFVKKPVKCGNCGGENHTARSCPSKGHKPEE